MGDANGSDDYGVVEDDGDNANSDDNGGHYDDDGDDDID